MTNQKSLIQSHSFDGFTRLYSFFLNSLFTQDSSIIDFYPDDFAIDLNGKKYAWQGESPSCSIPLILEVDQDVDYSNSHDSSTENDLYVINNGLTHPPLAAIYSLSILFIIVYSFFLGMLLTSLRLETNCLSASF